jgi:hypothetical protein
MFLRRRLQLPEMLLIEDRILLYFKLGRWGQIHHRTDNTKVVMGGARLDAALQLFQ